MQKSIGKTRVGLHVLAPNVAAARIVFGLCNAARLFLSILMAALPLADASNASNTTTHQPHIPPIGLKLPSAEPAKQSALPLRAAGGNALLEGDSNSTKISSTAEDPLTPRILEALARLDAEAAALGALSPRAMAAAEAPSAAAAQQENDEEPEWLTAAAEEAAASHQPSSSSGSEVQEAARAQQVLDAAAALPVCVASLGRELRQSEEACRHLRSSALTQAATAQEVSTQLDLTKSAAEATAAAARRIVDDHEKDVTLLLAELRRLSPEACERIEGRLSAPLVALAARRKHAQAASAHRRKQRAASPRPMRPGGTSSAAAGGGGGSCAPHAARAESPIMERLSAAAADLADKVAKRASSPWRGRPRFED